MKKIIAVLFLFLSLSFSSAVYAWDIECVTWQDAGIAVLIWD